MTKTSDDKRLYWLAGNRAPGQDAFFVEALDKTVWKPGSADNWDTCWYTGMPDADVFEQLSVQKSINHIPGNNGLTIKDFLYETLRSSRERLADDAQKARMDYFPRVYAMPDDFHALQQCALDYPAKKWILKPKNSSRGRGIEVVQDIADIPLAPSWMVQEYIDNPHVMRERKYVLRLYVLVSSVEPLRVYLHREGFAKLASEPYNIEDPDNPFAHLTNPDINATNTDAEAPVVFVGLSDYRQWLRDEGHDDEALFTKIRDLVTLSVIAVRERMRQRLKAQNAPADGCYELLGVDCLVDADLKPWILECNLSPSLEVCAAPEDGGDTETTIKRTMVADMVSLLGLNTPVKNAQTLGKEERIAHDNDGELARVGGFERLFPAKDTVEDYLSFFPVPRLADRVSARHVKGAPLDPVSLVPNRTTEIISEDELALYNEASGTLYTPNSVSGWIWLQIADGADPEAITQALMASHEAAHGAPDKNARWMIRENVWDALSNWAQLGLLRRAGASDAPRQAVKADPPAENPAQTLLLGQRAVSLSFGCPAVAERLKDMFSPLITQKKPELAIAVQRAPVGYALSVGTRLITTGLGLDTIAQVVSRALFEQAPAQEDEIALAGTLVPLNEREAVWFAARRERQWEDALALMFSTFTHHGFAGGARLNLTEAETLAPIGLPVRLNKADLETLEQALGITAPKAMQNWATGGKGRLLASTLPPRAQAYHLRAIIVPERSKESETALSSMSVHRALDALLVSATGLQGVGLSGQQVGALNDRLGQCNLYKIGFNDIEHAAKALAKALVTK
jgi:Tubulin-tyrosine ligase family